MIAVISVDVHFGGIFERAQRDRGEIARNSVFGAAAAAAAVSAASASARFAFLIFGPANGRFRAGNDGGDELGIVVKVAVATVQTARFRRANTMDGEKRRIFGLPRGC